MAKEIQNILSVTKKRITLSISPKVKKNTITVYSQTIKVKKN